MRMRVLGRVSVRFRVMAKVGVRGWMGVCMCACTYVYVCICVYLYVCGYVSIQELVS